MRKAASAGGRGAPAALRQGGATRLNARGRTHGRTRRPASFAPPCSAAPRSALSNAPPRSGRLNRDAAAAGLPARRSGSSGCGRAAVWRPRPDPGRAGARRGPEGRARGRRNRPARRACPRAADRRRARGTSAGRAGCLREGGKPPGRANVPGPKCSRPQMFQARVSRICSRAGSPPVLPASRPALAMTMSRGRRPGSGRPGSGQSAGSSTRRSIERARFTRLLMVPMSQSRMRAASR